MGTQYLFPWVKTASGSCSGSTCTAKLIGLDGTTAFDPADMANVDLSVSVTDASKACLSHVDYKTIQSGDCGQNGERFFCIYDCSTSKKTYLCEKFNALSIF